MGTSSHPRTSDRGAGSAAGLDARRDDAGIATLFGGGATQQTGVSRPKHPTGGVLGWALPCWESGSRFLDVLIESCGQDRAHAFFRADSCAGSELGTRCNFYAFDTGDGFQPSQNLTSGACSPRRATIKEGSLLRPIRPQTSHFFSFAILFSSLLF